MRFRPDFCIDWSRFDGCVPRCGSDRLMATLGLLGEDAVGRSLWDLEDEELASSWSGSQTTCRGDRTPDPTLSVTFFLCSPTRDSEGHLDSEPRLQADSGAACYGSLSATRKVEVSPDAVDRVRAKTPARILTGRAGGSYRTETLLRLRADHAAARDAVTAELDLERDLGRDFVDQVEAV